MTPRTGTPGDCWQAPQPVGVCMRRLLGFVWGKLGAWLRRRHSRPPTNNPGTGPRCGILSESERRALLKSIERAREKLRGDE